MVHTQLFSELTNRHDGWERQMLEGLTSAYLQETLAAVVQGQCLRDLFTCIRVVHVSRCVAWQPAVRLMTHEHPLSGQSLMEVESVSECVQMPSKKARMTPSTVLYGPTLIFH